MTCRSTELAVMVVFYTLVVGSQHTCKEGCMKIGGSYITRSEATNETLLEQFKSNVADFLFTAPCPPIWNFTLACNYFSRDTISCEESTAILKRCLDFYDPYIPCNTTIEVIEQCMSENSTMCGGLTDLYDKYCNNTCRIFCDSFTDSKEQHHITNDSRFEVLTNSTSGNNPFDVEYPMNRTVVAEHFPLGDNFSNLSSTNGSDIKVIQVHSMRTVRYKWTCGPVCIILMIAGFVLSIAVVGVALFCVLKRLNKDDKSYRVHSKDKCVGPDGSGHQADSALLPELLVKEQLHHQHQQHHPIPARYRDVADVQDTSFIHIRRCSNGTSSLLTNHQTGEDIDEENFS